MPRALRLTAAFFYLALVAAAVIWTLLAGRPVLRLVWDSEQATATRAFAGLLAGVAFGLAIVGLSRVTIRYFGWARKLYAWFAQLLGPLRWRDAALLAALSSTGEELLFRGAMQPSLGLWWTALIFGLAHLPPQPQLLPWTFGAALIGLAVGWLTELSGCLAGAVAAHFVINLLNLRHVTQFCEKLPADRPPPSIPTHDDEAPDQDRGPAVDDDGAAGSTDASPER